MEERYFCDICGKTHYDLDEYVKCVSKCVEKLKKEKAEEKNKKRLEDINIALHDVKQAKEYYEQRLEEFKEKYPEEYKLNFGSEEISCDSCNDRVKELDCDDCDFYYNDECLCEYDCEECPCCNGKCGECDSYEECYESELSENKDLNNKEDKMKSMEFSYESNGKDKPKFYAFVNGKRVDDDSIKKLLEDPETNYFARVLGII